ncbi:ABC transporter transmembrane domain-containing protein [Zhihengliuella sp.]|uniref:ABC transporter transmembrane domain-containing protein n=1 Tax=Zhihengliuella sp. TaxID=1954483 RepID=UPI0028111FB9|nr:ABC transporter transmembrane domain-containing protein [Zhihengliuella sp.]
MESGPVEREPLEHGQAQGRRDECGRDRRLPPLLIGSRRWYLAGLVVLALVRAGASVLAAALAGRLVGAAGTGAPVQGLLVAAAAAVVAVGASVFAEGLVAEQLGQDYIHELRVRLVRSTLDSERTRSAGVTIARSTNDLTAVRNWVAQGIAPLVAGIPLVVVTLGWLCLTNVWLGVAVGVPLLLLVAVLLVLARPAYERARAVRRARGRLAAQVADTVHARDAVRFGGGTSREARRVDRAGQRVVEAALSRARITGGLRSAAMVAPIAASLGVGLLASSGRVDAATAASALMLAGVIGAQCTELGRVVEYRQNFRAARRIIAPVIEESGVARPAAVESATARPARGDSAGDARPGRVGGASADGGSAPGPLVLARPSVDDGVAADPLISAVPGEVVRLVGGDAQVEAVFQELAGLAPDRAECRLGGRDLAAAGARERRLLVGHAASGLPLERGSILRAVRYRVPDAGEDEACAALAAAGADPAAWDATLPQGLRTLLRNGGQPLSIAQRAQVRMARALLGTPPLLLLDRIDAELDRAGREALRELVRDYPGIVVLATHGDGPAPGARTVVVPG